MVTIVRIKEITANHKKRKDKKKKKVKPMEEDKENSPINIEKTKVYQTLTEFSQLQMQKEEIYHFLEQYVLNEEELKRNKYPVPGTIAGETFAKDGFIQRKCCRCYKSFHVSLNGFCESTEKCTYHLQKPIISNGNMMFECCGKPQGSLGCKTFSSHICGKPVLHNVDFKSSREKRHVRAEEHCAVYALDCEMVFTNLGLQLAKIGIVNIEGLTVYESFVLPENDVIDFNTTYSGITPKDLKGITTTLADVQSRLDQMLNKDTILIGHGLESDLKTLRLMHFKVIDTAVLFPRENGSKRKLKELALDYLNIKIQDKPNGHDCIEDARACMALMLYKIKQDYNKLATTHINSSLSEFHENYATQVNKLCMYENEIVHPRKLYINNNFMYATINGQPSTLRPYSYWC